VSTPLRTDQPDVVTSDSQPAPEPAEPQGRLVRSTARPGLSGTGVGVLGGAIGLVASILAELLTGGLGWVFGVPFVLVSAYCAAEVTPRSMRSAIVMPPLVALLVAAVNPLWSGETSGIRGWLIKTLTTLTTMAPTLVAATGVAALIVGVRYWRAKRAK
jgi:hypothetical protein